ncbi:hypothetical protein HYU22_04515 [Candidatus Woesearchaeota archaeon]|nr:hypothetical protein [Candidatus Woesearchaeota archaeon]
MIRLGLRWLFIFLLIAVPVSAELSSLSPRTAELSLATRAIKEHDFSVDILAYPFLQQSPHARLNNYKAVIYFDPNYLRFVSIENKVDGLTVDYNNIAGGSIEFGASKAFGAFYQMQPITLATITFVPVRGGQSELTFQSLTIINSLGEGGVTASLIDTLQGASVSVSETGGSGGCRPNCQGKTCGPDGCGNVCGICPQSTQCQQNSCVCIPDCEGRECGPDGCGGSCGTCLPRTVCQAGERTSSCVSGIPQLTATKELQQPEQPKTGFKYLNISLGVLLIILAIVVYLIYRKKSAAVLNTP